MTQITSNPFMLTPLQYNPPSDFTLFSNFIDLVNIMNEIICYSLCSEDTTLRIRFSRFERKRKNEANVQFGQKVGAHGQKVVLLTLLLYLKVLLWFFG